jgi:hypothetical protein
MTCSGLQLVRFSSEERRDQVMQIRREHGVCTADPPVCIVEDGQQDEVKADVVATRMRFDPAGLLEPGQLRGRGQRGRILADVAAGRVSPATLPRFQHSL